MRFQPRDILLRDGTTVHLHPVDPDRDAADLRSFQIEHHGSMPYVLTLPDEVRPLDAYRERLRIFDQERGGLMLAARSGGAVVGCAELCPGQRTKNAHVAELGIGLAAPFRGRGLGRAMMAALLDHARAHPALLKVELTVVDKNTAAVELYLDLGFTTEGRRRAALRQPDGALLDVLTMGLWVGETPP